MRHTALWSCTHIPNIIDLSGKTKKLWSGQASLRRSGRRSRSEEEEKIRLKQYVSLRSKGRHNKIGICCFFNKQATIRRKSRNQLARNQDNVSE
jgi:hypothetical protein